MDRIQTYRRRSILFLVSFLAVGVVFFLTIMRLAGTGNVEAPMVLLAAVWVMFYVQYVNLKTKAEILTEFKKHQPGDAVSQG